MTKSTGNWQASHGDYIGFWKQQSAQIPIVALSRHLANFDTHNSQVKLYLPKREVRQNIKVLLMKYGVLPRQKPQTFAPSPRFSLKAFAHCEGQNINLEKP
jgi:hypothetical protein